MMDDLISRKSLLECAEYDDKGRLVIPYRKVENAPTAFDKEKVRRELIELRNEEIYKPDSINKYTEARSQGRYSAFLDAIRIVEKGGIE